MNVKELKTKNKILNTSKEHFFKFGYTKSNLDEITKELGMSKKTLYKYFENKKAILNCVVKDMMDEVSNKIDCVLQNKKAAFLEKQKELIHFISFFISRVKILIQDIQKNEPETWNQINEFRKKKFFEKFKIIFAEAQNNKDIRSDIPLDLAMRILFNMIENMTNFKDTIELPDSMEQIIDSTFKIFFEGIKQQKE